MLHIYIYIYIYDISSLRVKGYESSGCVLLSSKGNLKLKENELESPEIKRAGRDYVCGMSMVYQETLSDSDIRLLQGITCKCV